MVPRVYDVCVCGGVGGGGHQNNCTQQYVFALHKRPTVDFIFLASIAGFYDLLP